jgi:hypothetical protein
LTDADAKYDAIAELIRIIRMGASFRGKTMGVGEPKNLTEPLGPKGLAVFLQTECDYSARSRNLP